MEAPIIMGIIKPALGLLAPVGQLAERALYFEAQRAALSYCDALTEGNWPICGRGMAATARAADKQRR